jgi:hypothetical protein
MTTVMLENIKDIICLSKMICGIEIWVVKGGWATIDKMQGRFWKAVLRSPPCAVNGTVEHGVGREGKEGRCSGE